MSFALDLQRFAEKAGKNADAVVRHVAISVADSMVMKSPVDTGRFRANWQHGDNTVNTSTTDSLDPGGSAALSRLAASLSNTKAGGIQYITNSLPYAQRLEYGWSQQAPQGFVRLTVAELQQFVDKAVSRVNP